MRGGMNLAYVMMMVMVMMMDRHHDVCRSVAILVEHKLDD